MCHNQLKSNISNRLLLNLHRIHKFMLHNWQHKIFSQPINTSRQRICYKNLPSLILALEMYTYCNLLNQNIIDQQRQNQYRIHTPLMHTLSRKISYQLLNILNYHIKHKFLQLHFKEREQCILNNQLKQNILNPLQYCLYHIHIRLQDILIHIVFDHQLNDLKYCNQYIYLKLHQQEREQYKLHTR